MRINAYQALFTACLAAGPLLTTACVSPSSPAAPASEDTGTVSMDLQTVTGGATYQLSNLEILIEGPTFQFLEESNPSETVLSTTLPTGAYTSFLEDFTLEREDSMGNFSPVIATLTSSSFNPFTIFNGTTTTLTYQFQTDGQIVTVGSGTLDVMVNVTQTPGACTPLGTDCAIPGTWCPPTGLTGADLACIPAGTVALGQPCAMPTDCVADASCFNPGTGPVCTALCSSADFTMTCATGGVCTSAASDYGFCE